VDSTGASIPTTRTLLAAIVNSTDDAVVSIDIDGVVTSWNRGAEQLYGISVDHALSANFSEVLPSSASDLFTALRSAKTHVSHRREIERALPNGRHVLIDETLSVLKDDDGHVVGAASISRDIGARREIEEALALTRHELEIRNQRLERSNADLEEFAYIASHDLSEPLRAVSGMVELLRRRYRSQLDDDADTFIDFAVEGCLRMRTMIEDLLAYSRVGSEGLNITTTEIRTLVDRSLDSLRVEIEDSGAAITVEDLPTLRVDAIKLGQVIQNLISNSLKFRRSDTVISIRVSAQLSEGGGWRIEVSDNGIGIDPRHHTQVFRMFKRLHNREKYPGTGIGLSIAERIINAHGGAIGLTESDQGGVCAWFTIPETSRERT
jgi:PAS domain S-box-containing protein